MRRLSGLIKPSELIIPSTSRFILPEKLGSKKYPPKEESMQPQQAQKPSPSVVIHKLTDTQELIDMNCGIGNTPQAIKNGKVNPLAGKVVTFSKSWESTTLSPDDTEEFSAILSCGLGGASSEDGLFESFYPIEKLMRDSGKLMVYASLTDSDRREERFRKGIPYYYNESYINQEESENFFNQVLKNRFFDKGGKLNNPKDIKKIILFGFSIGHRENKSHINFLYQRISEALEKEGRDQKQIKEYFNKIALVNIASPVNWEGRKLSEEIIKELDEGRISPQDAENYYNAHKETQNLHSKPMVPLVREVGFRSVLDMGTAKPESDFNNFHCNQDLYRARIFRFVRPEQRTAEMYLFGKGAVDKVFDGVGVDNGYKQNKLGHNLTDYSAAIFNNAEAICRVHSLELSTDFQYMPKVNFDERTFDKDRIPEDVDIGILQEEWHRALLDRAVTKLYQDLVNQEQKNTRG